MHSPDPVFSLAIAAALLLLNAFFVLAEFALIRVRSSRIEVLASQGSLAAAMVKSMVEQIDAYLSAIQLGMTMASLGLGWVGEPAVARLLEPLIRSLPPLWAHTLSHTIAFTLAFVAITFLHVVAGELLPKSIAIRYPTQSALLTAPPLQFFRKLCYVPMLAVSKSAGLLLRLLHLKGADERELAHSEEELKLLLSYAQEHGSLPLQRLLLFENLFDFGNTSVRDVMTPASAVASLCSSKPWEENLAVIRARKHTRYPLRAQESGDFQGVVHLKDILLAGNAAAPDLAALRRPPAFLPEDAPLEKALESLRKKRVHLALVQNKTGAVTGLITLEDVLEELVGEIQDEFEAAPAGTLSDAIVHEAVEIWPQAADKAAALKGMIERLVAARGLDFKEVWDVVWKREQTLSSAVGRGLALPHGRLQNLERPVVAIGRFPKGLAFEAPDKKPVYLIFLILTPLKEPGAQLRLLAKVAALASHPTSRRNFRRAKNPRELIEVISAFEQSVAE